MNSTGANGAERPAAVEVHASSFLVTHAGAGVEVARSVSPGYTDGPWFLRLPSAPDALTHWTEKRAYDDHQAAVVAAGELAQALARYRTIQGEALAALQAVFNVTVAGIQEDAR